MLNGSKREYEQALKCGGYSNISLSFQQSSTSQVKQQGHRNLIWIDPPYNRAVTTNVAISTLILTVRSAFSAVKQ